MCDSCNLFSRSNIKKGLRFLKGQEQTHAISIRLLGNYFHCNKIWMVFQCSNICSFCTYCLLYWLRQRLCSSDQTNLPPTSKTQGRNPMTDSRQTDAALNCGCFFNLHLASLWGLWRHSTDTSNCNPLAGSSKKPNPVAHQNTQTPLLETTKPSDSCPWRYGGTGLIGRH